MHAIKAFERINEQEMRMGSTQSSASWHSDYADCPFIFFGGLPFDLNEGDILTIFSQFGEIIDIDLIRDPITGRSQGFGFLRYLYQKSTVLAVDNFNGAKIFDRIIRVNHALDYKKKSKNDAQNPTASSSNSITSKQNPEEEEEPLLHQMLTGKVPIPPTDPEEEYIYDDDDQAYPKTPVYNSDEESMKQEPEKPIKSEHEDSGAQNYSRIKQEPRRG